MGKVRSCLPPPLGPALLPQCLQEQLPSENGKGPCVPEKVVWLLTSRNYVSRREISARPSWSTLSDSFIRSIPTKFSVHIGISGPASRRLAPSLNPPLPFRPFSARRLPCRPTRRQKTESRCWPGGGATRPRPQRKNFNGRSRVKSPKRRGKRVPSRHPRVLLVVRRACIYATSALSIAIRY